MSAVGCCSRLDIHGNVTHNGPMSKYLTADEVREELRDHVDRHGSQLAAAKALDLDPAEVSRVLRGLEPPRRFAERLGFELLSVYRRKPTHD